MIEVERCHVALDYEDGSGSMPNSRSFAASCAARSSAWVARSSASGCLLFGLGRLLFGKNCTLLPGENQLIFVVIPA